MKKVFKVLFKLTTVIEAILGVIVALLSLTLLILYQTNQTRFNPSNGEYILIPGFPGQPIAGMVFFLAGLLAIILAVVVVYTSLPFIFKKDEKLEPNRLIPFFGAASGLFALVEAIFAFVMISIEGSRYTVAIFVLSLFLIFVLIHQFLMLIPTIVLRYNYNNK